jgi:hypothetical protein
MDLRCNFDAIAIITIFCTVVLSVIQGVALNTKVLPFSKGRVLHCPRLTLRDRIHKTYPTLDMLRHMWLRACLFGLWLAGCAGKAAVQEKLLCRESCCSECNCLANCLAG